VIRVRVPKRLCDVCKPYQWGQGLTERYIRVYTSIYGQERVGIYVYTRKQIGLKLPVETIEAVDQARGLVSRSAWILDAIARKLEVSTSAGPLQGLQEEALSDLRFKAPIPSSKPPLPVASARDARPVRGSLESPAAYRRRLSEWESGEE
jgi:hypothetical protein